MDNILAEKIEKIEKELENSKEKENRGFLDPFENKNAMSIRRNHVIL